MAVACAAQLRGLTDDPYYYTLNVFSGKVSVEQFMEGRGVMEGCMEGIDWRRVDDIGTTVETIMQIAERS